MWNKLYIIIDKKSTKPILIWKLSGQDIVVMVIGFCVGFFSTKLFFNDLIALVVGSAFFIVLGFLLLELSNHLSILQHIQKWYRYRYHSPMEYFYIPKSEIKKEKKQNSIESLEWQEYQDMIERNRKKNWHSID